MSTDVRGYLASKGIHLKNADKRNVHCACFWCGEDPQKRGRLYINTDEDADIPGLFMCHICGEKGSLKKIKRYFGDPTDDHADAGIVHYDILAAGASYFHKALNEHPAAVQYFEEERGLTRETIKRFKLGWADGKVSAHLRRAGFEDYQIKAAGFLTYKGDEFFNQVYTIPYYIGPTCVGVRQKEPGGKYKQPQGFGQRPFNIPAGDADEIILTEGEFDCMIAEQLGYTAIGVPGATQWQESWNSYVKDARRVWCVFDNDDAGRKNSARIEEIIGPRCKALTIPQKPQGHEDDHNDLSDWIVQEKHTGEDLAALLKKYRTTLLITVSEAIAEWAALEGTTGYKFGFEYLDAQIAPGLRPGEVVIFQAKTGTGKTLWLLNTFDQMANADLDLRFLFLSLEQTRADWFTRARRIRAFFHDECLERAPTDESPDELKRFERWASEITEDFWTPRLMMTDKNRMNEDQIRVVLDDYDKEMGGLPQVVSIDYLGYLARGFKGGDKYHQVSEAVMAVKEIAKDYRIAILIPSQSSRAGQHGQKLSTDTLRDSGAIEETGDFVFSMRNPDYGKSEGLEGVRMMLIDKSRHGGDGTDVSYQWGKQSLVLVPRNYQDGPAGPGLTRYAHDETIRMEIQPSFAHVWHWHRNGGRH